MFLGFCDDFCALTSYWVFGSLLNSLLFILRELAGEGSVAVGVGISDKRQVIGDTQHATCDIRHYLHYPHYPPRDLGKGKQTYFYPPLVDRGGGQCG